MKIGVLTFHWANNYGALLQTYALCETLKKLGCEVDLINLYPKKEKKDIRYLFSSIPFNSFRKQFLPEQKQLFYSSKELMNCDFNHDLYIVGSDQVWNKEITTCQIYSYFFDFLPDNKKRISYAASFGISEWMFNIDETNRISELINRFHKISVREKTGKTLINEHLSFDASVVLDPTLLLGDFSNLIRSNTKPKDEIVCFKFRKDTNFFKFASKLSKIEKKKIRLLNNNRPILGYKWSPFTSIPQLITYIKQSSLVVTDSFHITCIAIIFKKPMIILPANPKRTGRITELLSMLDIKDHFYNSYDEALESKYWRNDIDYELVSIKLKKLREESIDFLFHNIY